MKDLRFCAEFVGGAILLLLAGCTQFSALTDGNAFTVATYNVRFHVDADGPELTWAKRLPRIAQVVREGGFDLIGFQEVTAEMYPSVCAAFPEYRFADDPNEVGAVRIAYRPEIFELCSIGRFSLSETPDDLTAKSWGSSGVRICQWALFIHRASGRRVRVFNTHPDWKSAMARAKGMDMMLARIKFLKTVGESVILLGDMNDNENGEGVDRWSPADPNYPFGGSIARAKRVLRDSRDCAATRHDGPEKTYHAFTANAICRFDYIFITDDFKVYSHRTHDLRPGGGYPSDHDPVSAKVSW